MHITDSFYICIVLRINNESKFYFKNLLHIMKVIHTYEQFKQEIYVTQKLKLFLKNLSDNVGNTGSIPGPGRFHMQLSP